MRLHNIHDSLPVKISRYVQPKRPFLAANRHVEAGTSRKAGAAWRDCTCMSWSEALQLYVRSQVIKATDKKTGARTLALNGLNSCVGRWIAHEPGALPEKVWQPCVPVLQSIWKGRSEAAIDRTLAAYLQGSIYKVLSDGELQAEHARMLARAARISLEASAQERGAMVDTWERKQPHDRLTGRLHHVSAASVLDRIYEWTNKPDTTPATADEKQVMADAYRAQGFTAEQAKLKVDAALRELTGDGATAKKLHWPGGACESCGVSASAKKLLRCTRCNNAWYCSKVRMLRCSCSSPSARAATARARTLCSSLPCRFCVCRA